MSQTVYLHPHLLPAPVTPLIFLLERPYDNLVIPERILGVSLVPSPNELLPASYQALLGEHLISIPTVTTLVHFFTHRVCEKSLLSHTFLPSSAAQQLG
jgi:hypothetical protein